MSVSGVRYSVLFNVQCSMFHVRYLYAVATLEFRVSVRC
jgi:hypothetical protein